MKRLRFTLMPLLLVLTVLVSACGADATPTQVSGGGTSDTPTAAAGGPDNTTPAAASTSGTPTADPDKLVRIGLAFATSGDNAVYGKSQRQAAELAWKEWQANGGINGFPIAATFQDTAGKPDQAISIFQGFIKTDKVLAIIGPTLSNEAKSSDLEAQKASVPVLAVSNTTSGVTEIGDYIFRDSLAEAQVIPETVKQVKDKLGIKTASILYARDDAFSKSGYDIFKAELEKN